MNKSIWSENEVVTVAIGFDDHSVGLLAAAAALCKRTDKTLALLHVVEPWSYNPGVPAFGFMTPVLGAMAAASEEAQVAASQRLLEMARLVTPEVKVLAEVISGHLVETLCEQAKKLGSCLLIVGAKYADEKQPPRSGFSTALAVLNASSVPVLVLDSQAPARLSDRLATLMIADDLGPSGRAASQFGIEMAIALGNTSLNHVHVNGVRPEVLEAAVTSAVATSHTPADPKLSATKLFQSLLDNLAAALQERLEPNRDLLMRFDCSYSASVVTGDVVDEMAKIAETVRPDVLIFGRHRTIHTQPFFLGRVPFKAMLKLRRPVLVVPGN